MLPHCEDVVGATAEGKPVTWAQITDAVEEMREWLALKLTTGACAHRLVYELAGHWCRMPQMLGDKLLLVDVHAVLDQIGAMEKAPMTRAVPTKPETPFSGPLTGLWHKHWFQASFLVRNLAEEFGQRGMAPVFKRWTEQYGKRGWEGRLVDEEMAKLIAHAVVDDHLESRAGSAAKGAQSRLTGEWIIFAKSQGRNIYLTLGAHGEDNSEILSRCMPAAREFPELLALEPFKSI